MGDGRRAICFLAYAVTLALSVAACGGTTKSSDPTATPTMVPITAPATAVPPTATSTPVPTATATTNPILGLPIDQTVALPGLPGVGDVVVDEIGIPHIYTNDLGSALYLQGYVTAASRFWSMDAFRRVGEGRLSEIFGAITLSTDVAMRVDFTTRDGRRLEEALWEHIQANDPRLTAALQAYANGVNAWLADLRAGRNGATLPPEYQLFLINLGVNDLAAWRPQDTIAIARLQAWSLSNSLGSEISFARTQSQVPPALRDDVFRAAPSSPATVLPVAQPLSLKGRSAARIAPALPPLRVLEEVSAFLSKVDEASPLGRPEPGLGSNNWIVSPQKSANGFAMLANDPHLGLFNAPIWFMQQIDVAGTTAESGRINGVNFPGLPGVVLGHNDFGAWGGTVAVFDVTDVYVETITTPPDYPASPRTVLFNGEQVPVLRIEEQFGQKGGNPVTHVIEVVPHHGPMVPDPNLNDDVVGLAATGMSFRWTGHEVTNDVRFLLDLNMARNVQDFKNAVREFAVGAQNWVWADVHGDIAYFPYVLVPQRPAGTVPFLPVPGTGEAEWLTDQQGRTLWLPEEKFPQATNPPQGFLATSNNDQIGNTLDNDPLNDDIYLTFSADIGFRQERILELLSNETGERADPKMTAEDLSRYQYDTSSKEAARLLPFLTAAATNRPDLVSAAMADALARLQQWGEAKVGSPPFDMAAGIDPATLRNDVPPPATPVSDEQKTDAVAASLFVGWASRLVPAVFNDDFAGTGIGAPGGADATKALLHVLEDIDRTDAGFVVHTKGANGESAVWDNHTTPEVETRDEALLTALRDALPFLAEKFSDPAPENWLWGKIHQVRLQHFFGQAGIPSFDLGPFAAPGGRFTVNPANYSLTSNNFNFQNGASKRFVAILDPAGIRAVNTIPGGQNGNPGGFAAEKYNRINPEVHYGDLLPAWIRGETFDYHISRDDVAANAVRRVRYTP